MTKKQDKDKKLGVLAGTGLLDAEMFSEQDPSTVDTGRGPVPVYHGDGFVFIQRHHGDGDRDYTPPHEIDHHSHILAMDKMGVSRIFSVQSVGSLTNDIPPGRFVIPSDFINLWQTHSFYSDDRGHRAVSFDSTLRVQIREVLKQRSTKLNEDAVYAQTIGPRFETPAEAKLLAQFADVVGMTAVPEVVLSSEKDIPYATLCCADNYVNGIQGTELTYEKFQKKVEKHQPDVVRASESVIEELT